MSLCLFIIINDAYIMHVNKRKFERNSSLENYRMTYNGKKKTKTKLAKEVYYYAIVNESFHC